MENLATLVPVERIAVSVRDARKAQDLAARGIQVREGDFARPESLRGAFEGASQLLLVSSNAAAYGGDPLAQHRAAIDAARAAGVRRVVYTSHMAASPTSEFAPTRDHAATERMLGESGLAWTALRNGFYASAALLQLGPSLHTGTFSAPVDGKVSWTAHADLGRAAAVILANEGKYDGPTPPLTAAQALDFDELCAIASSVAGRPIQRITVSEDELRAKFAAAGMPAARSEIMLGMYRASHHGEFAAVDPTLRNLIGREPMSMREVLAEQRTQAA